MKILSLWPWPQGHSRGGDGVDKKFRPISTIMPNMNEIHQMVFKIWGLINFNAKHFDPKTKIKYEQIMLQRTDVQTNRFLADSYSHSTFQLGDNEI